MRYIAKSEDGRTVGEGRTLVTAVKWAKKRDGAYVVDNETGAIQWRKTKPQAVKPSPLPLKVYADKNTDGFELRRGEYPYQRVGNVRQYGDAALIVRAVNAHAGFVTALKDAREVFINLDNFLVGDAKLDASERIDNINAALRAAGEEV